MRVRSLFTFLFTMVAVAAAFAQTAQSPAAAVIQQFDAAQQRQQNPFYGSAATETPTGDVLQLHAIDAIDRGLKHNLGLFLGEQGAQSARGARLQSLAQLLPNVTGRIGESVQKINLAAYGFPRPAGTPDVVGPFSVFDGRAYLTQNIFDARALHSYRAASANLEAAQLSFKEARELVVLVVSALYLQAVAQEARVESLQAQVQTAKTLFDQATSMKNAGVVAGIDALRAQVQYQGRRQQLLAAQNELERQKLTLGRAIGLAPGQQYAIVDRVPYAPLPPMTLDIALDRAFRDRPEMQRVQAQLRAAEALKRAAQAERLPSLQATADYGVIGRTPGSSRGTFSIAAGLRIPIFQGRRVEGQLTQAEAQLRQREAEAADMRNRVEVDIRTAFLDVQNAAEQVEVTQSSVELARRALEQSKDRFANGVTNNLEVVQSQEALAGAEEQYIASVFAHNVAKAALAKALGVGETATKNFLEGLK